MTMRWALFDMVCGGACPSLLARLWRGRRGPPPVGLLQELLALRRELNQLGDSNAFVLLSTHEKARAVGGGAGFPLEESKKVYHFVYIRSALQFVARSVCNR